MICVLSPAKTLDFEHTMTGNYTTPDLMADIGVLVRHLQTFSSEDLARLMGISERLAHLNHDRFQNFDMTFPIEKCRQAIMAFQGQVYQEVPAADYNQEEVQFAQDHVRILSGLYGLLKPLDLIQPYRLEMGTRLQGPWGKNLYAFWGDRIAQAINDQIDDQTGKQTKELFQEEPVLVNLASAEYFKAVSKPKLKARLLNIVFKEKKGEQFKVVGVYAKKARGMMTHFIVRNKIFHSHDLKAFDGGGYSFHQGLSTENEWVFTRNMQK